MTWIYLLGAYLIGSIPTALLVGKIAFGIDIREHGSNNPGATNSLRVLGKKAALIVLIVDVGKGVLAASLPSLFDIAIDPLYVGFLAVIGHCFPIFAGFRGGKAIATTAGVLLVANPVLLLVVYITFFLVIFITKYVFLGSISVGITLLIYGIFEKRSDYDMIFFIFLLFLIYLHRSNIRNFLLNREPKINDKNLKNDLIVKK